MKRLPVCQVLGLTSAEVASLGGFSSRALAVLAHLRDAWLAADNFNKRHVVLAMKELLASKTMQEEHKLAVKTLKHTLHLEHVNQLFEELHPYLTGQLL